MKSRIFTLLKLGVIAISLILGLYYWSLLRQQSSNGFLRKVNNKHITLQKVIDLKYNTFYFAGVDSSHVFLGSHTAPLRILVWNQAFSSSQVIELKLDTMLRYYDPTLVVGSDWLWITDYGTLTMMKGSLKDRKIMVIPHDMFFAEALPLNQSSLVIRTFDSSGKTYVLTKYSPLGIKEKQQLPLGTPMDGTFSTDGILKYDPLSHQLVYTYFYKNQFLCLDTNMYLLYRGQTIDTNTKAKLKLGRIESEQVTQMAAPPLVVNVNTAVYDHLLYIQSSLRSDNEEQISFSSSPLIDVYDLQRGQYLYSFHLEKIGSKKLNNFIVFDHSLMAIADHYLYSFSLSP